MTPPVEADDRRTREARFCSWAAACSADLTCASVPDQGLGGAAPSSTGSVSGRRLASTLSMTFPSMSMISRCQPGRPGIAHGRWPRCVPGSLRTADRRRARPCRLGEPQRADLTIVPPEDVAHHRVLVGLDDTRCRALDQHGVNLFFGDRAAAVFAYTQEDQGKQYGDFHRVREWVLGPHSGPRGTPAAEFLLRSTTSSIDAG